jgi:hypothetical protein
VKVAARSIPIEAASPEREMVENGEGGSAKHLKPPNWADADN